MRRIQVQRQRSDTTRAPAESPRDLPLVRDAGASQALEDAALVMAQIDELLADA